MRHSKFNRYERKQIQQDKIAQSLMGYGLFVYKNPSRTGTLTLPKPTASGRRTIGPGEEFQGDSYFMNLVQTQDLIKVRTLISIEQDKAEKAKAANPVPALENKQAPVNLTIDLNLNVSETKKKPDEHVLSEAVEDRSKKTPVRKENMNPKQKKLVLDQPDRVTNEGKVEQVVKDDGTQQLNDHNASKQPRPDVLLNEHPAGEIIIE
jgi:hypothetical protein